MRNSRTNFFSSVKSSIAFEKLEWHPTSGVVDATADIMLLPAARLLLGYGFMMGYSSGYCVKKVSK